MNPGGQLEIEVSGTLAGDEYDSVNVTGSAVVSGGTLALHFIDGFSPRNGQSYTFLQAAGGTTGSFTNIQLTGVAPGFTYHPVTNGNSSLSLHADNDGVAISASRLQVSRTGGSINISWPAPGRWVLQSSTSFPTAWTTVSATPLLQTNRFVVTLPMNQPHAYFRLRP